MSQFVTSSDVRAVVGDLQRRQVMDLLRAGAFIGALLLAWVTTKPFTDLRDQDLRDLTTGNETLTYLAFGALAALTIALALRDNARGLMSLISPGFVLFGGWIVLSVATPLPVSEATAQRGASL